MNSLNKLNDVFNIDTQVDLPVVSSVLENQESDFDLARNTLRNLIFKNEDAITELLHISKHSEHPRAYEVVGQLVKAQSDIAKELLNLHKTKKEISSDSPENIKTQNNILFAGSTSDLMKMISAQKAKTIDSK
jgi:endonuclease V-like protein UPF0215 family